MKIVNKLNPEDVYSPEGVKLFSFNELACRSSGIYAFHGNFLDELIKLRIVLNKRNLTRTSESFTTLLPQSVPGAPALAT